MKANALLLRNATRLHRRLISHHHHRPQPRSTTPTPTTTTITKTATANASNAPPTSRSLSTSTAATDAQKKQEVATTTVGILGTTRQQSSSQQTHNDKHTPSIAQYLGFGGTIPFLFGAVATSLYPEAEAIARATQLYGAVILSFLGGTQWGIAVTRRSSFHRTVTSAPTATATATAELMPMACRQLKADLTVSVLPSLAAWAATLAQPVTGLPVLAASLSTVFVYDRWRFAGRASLSGSGSGGSSGGSGGGGGRGNHVPTWYLRLRAPLTLAAAGGTAVTWLAVRRAGLADACADADVLLTEAGAGVSVATPMPVSMPVSMGTGGSQDGDGDGDGMPEKA